MIRGALLLTLALVAAGAAHAQLYRWVDEQGRVRYSDTPPPSSAKGVQKKSYSTAPGEPGIPYATQRAMREFPVVLYTSPECGKLCADAKGLLEKRGIPHREIVVRDEADIAALKKASGSQVPALLVGQEAISGFEAAAWSAALDKAGYPASAGFRRAAEK